MKTRMRLWLSGVLAFCLSAHGAMRTAYSQDSLIAKQIESLTDDDRNTRAEAINNLVKLGPDAVRPMINVLKSETEDLRREAVVVLGRIKDALAVDALIAALQDKDPIVGYRAAGALKEIKDARAVDALIAALKNGDSIVSYGAADALGAIGNPRAVEPLIAALKDANLLLRMQASAALVQLGPAAVDSLLAALNSQDDDVRREAAETLGNIKDARAINPLTALLKDPKSDVRSQAAGALARINESRGVNPATATLKEQGEVFRRLGADALEIKDTRVNRTFAAESLLKNDPMLKQRLIEWEKAAPESVTAQVKMLRSGNTSWKAAAAIQLRTSGSPAQGAILALVETLYDPGVDKQVYVNGGMPWAMTTVSQPLRQLKRLSG